MDVMASVRERSVDREKKGGREIESKRDRERKEGDRVRKRERERREIESER